MSMTLSTTRPEPPRSDPTERFVRPLHRAPRGVYLLDLDAAPPAGLLLPRLTPDEQRRAERLSTPLLRHRFAARRWGLRLALAAHSGSPAAYLSLSWDSGGRPRTRDTLLHISTSSAAGLGLVALSPHPVGTDLLHPCSAPDAAEACRALPILLDAGAHAALAPGRLALRLWTQLEATLKAAGLGLDNPGVAGCVRAEQWSPGGPCTLRIDSARATLRHWRVDALPVPESYIASLARPLAL
jgi:hypothetical protein